MNDPENRLSTDRHSSPGADVVRNERNKPVATALVLSLVVGAACFSLCRRPVSLAGRARTITLSAATTPKEVTALAEQLCSALHRIPSERIGACCGRSGGEFFHDECVSEVSTSLKNGATSLDKAKIDRCATAMQHALAGCDWVTPGQPLAPAECQGLFEPKLGEGAVCRSSLECVDNLHCAGASPKRTGRCTRPQGSGAACGTHTDSLAAYTLHRNLEMERPFCADFCSLTTHRCEPAPAAGTPCFSQINCARGQTCIRGACSADPPAAAGASCGEVPCQDGLRCIEGTCRAPADPGQSCRTSFECRRGGCVADDTGEGKCGAMCSVSTNTLRALAASEATGLR